MPFPTALKSLFSTFSVFSPKACPYAMMHSPIVADKNHRIWHEKSPRRWWLRGLGKGLFDVVLVQDEVDEGGYVAHINFSVAVDVGFGGYWFGAENYVD